MINYLITHQRRTRCLKSRAWACAVVEDRVTALLAHIVQTQTHKETTMYTVHACNLGIDTDSALS